MSFLMGKNFSKLVGCVLAGVLICTYSALFASEGQGFSTASACSVLVSEPGFQPNRSGYSILYDNVYSCGTPYKTLGTGDLPNNIALYGLGNQSEVTRVKLMLNVNVANRADADTKTLAILCTKMIEGLVGSSPSGLTQKIGQGKSFEEQFKGYRIFLTKDLWPTGNGFELNCGIATMGHQE
ncbi:hypothetical protein OH708_01010 [Pseudomonas capsici]|uniref:hypothetical protein n=1 Tax=Pseudomonas capsici TaxID=2810614 RepID=UPI000E3D7BF2|nr:hypothetical protein [Pseudomonas capsici]MCV4286475.1 hypothetical protein [Pseudomonas capsici]